MCPDQESIVNFIFKLACSFISLGYLNSCIDHGNVFSYWGLQQMTWCTEVGYKLQPNLSGIPKCQCHSFVF